jgi:hypothetical protein
VHAGATALSPDGALWAVMWRRPTDDSGQRPFLARWDGLEWSPTLLEVTLANDDAAVADWGGQLASGPESTLLELGAGEVARLDYGLQYPAFETGHALYYFTDGSMLHLMTCTDVQRPQDDWLSIAEAFEFLTAGEQVPGIEE